MNYDYNVLYWLSCTYCFEFEFYNRCLVGEFFGLFASLDSFMVAYVIMCPIGQLEYIFDAAAGEYK